MNEVRIPGSPQLHIVYTHTKAVVSQELTQYHGPRHHIHVPYGPFFTWRLGRAVKELNIASSRDEFNEVNDRRETEYREIIDKELTEKSNTNEKE